MRIAVIADTHLPSGSRRLPETCVEHLAAADLIVHAGDFTGPRALDEIESIGPALVAVHGNVDTAAVRARLPRRTTLDAAGARIGLVHDAGARRGRLARLRTGPGAHDGHRRCGRRPGRVQDRRASALGTLRGG